MFMQDTFPPGTDDEVAHPTRCRGVQTGPDRCPPSPYFPVQYSPMSKVIDCQTLRLQEHPKKIPPGEVPRQLQLYVEGSKVDLLKNGDQVTIIGSFLTRDGVGGGRGVQFPFIKVAGISGSSNNISQVPWSDAEEEKYKKFAARTDVLEALSKSIVKRVYQKSQKSNGAAVY